MFGTFVAKLTENKNIQSNQSQTDLGWEVGKYINK